MTLYPSGLLRDHPKMRSEEEVRRAIAAKRGTALSPKTVEPVSTVSPPDGASIAIADRGFGT